MSARPGAALAGRRVLEIADASGVYCGKLLADMGADVIKIERPGGDTARWIPPFWNDEPGSDTGLYFLYTNTSKRSVTLDFARPEGRELLLALARTADLIVETLPPGRLDALGLGFDALRRVRPSIVLTSITGFGQTGPRRDWRSCDLVASALGGQMYVTGEEADPPVKLAGSQAYMMASTYAASSSLIALFAAGRSGEGQHVDVSLQEGMASVTHIAGAGKWLDDGIVPRRRGSSLFASVPSGAYRCRDGLVYVNVNRPAHWKAIAAWIHEVTGIEEVLDPMFEGPGANRIEYRDLLDVYISELTARLTVDEVYREGQRRHIAVTPVYGAADLLRDEHLAARGYFVEADHGERGRLRYPGAPFRPSATPWRLRSAAPRAGEHTHEILCGELGVDEDRLRALREDGIV